MSYLLDIAIKKTVSLIQTDMNQFSKFKFADFFRNEFLPKIFNKNGKEFFSKNLFKKNFKNFFFEKFWKKN